MKYFFTLEVRKAMKEKKKEKERKGDWANKIQQGPRKT